MNIFLKLLPSRNAAASRVGLCVLATGAALLSVPALVAPSQAEVVYTPVNKAITGNARLKLDLNNNEVRDFTFSQSYGPLYVQTTLGRRLCGAIGGLSVAERRVNGVVNGAQVGWAAKLAYGSPIDSSVSFYLSSSLMYGFAEGCLPPHHRAYQDGYWNGARNAYLGLEFKIGGQTHYGWAQLSSNGSTYGVFTTLSGYAYETVAGKSIDAGQTQ